MYNPLPAGFQALAGINNNSASGIAIGNNNDPNQKRLHDNNSNCIVIGANSYVDSWANNCVITGIDSVISGDNSIAIGNNIICAHKNTTCIGNGAISTADDQIIIGGRNQLKIGALTLIGAPDPNIKCQICERVFPAGISYTSEQGPANMCFDCIFDSAMYFRSCQNLFAENKLNIEANAAAKK